MLPVVSAACRRFAATVLALALVAPGAAAQEGALPPHTTRVLDSLLAPFSLPGQPGASVLVVHRGVPVVQRSVGLSDVSAGTVATNATAYRLASLTKQFTATAVLQLADRAALRLDQPVREILPELPAYAQRVTVRHLLTHTSGLWDYEDFVPDTSTVQVSDADALRLVSARATRLYFAPGSEWRYSNTGYALLALIVERVTGSRFPDVLRERIFTPLGLRGTVAHVEGRDVVLHRAYGHTVAGRDVQRTDQSATSAVLGDGGVYSSIDDLRLRDAALARGGVVSDSAWRAATTPYTLSTGAPTSYGFGWFVETHLGRRRLRHHGETRGFTNAISRYPDDELTIIVLTNRTGSAPWTIADRLAAHFLR